MHQIVFLTGDGELDWTVIDATDIDDALAQFRRGYGGATVYSVCSMQPLSRSDASWRTEPAAPPPLFSDNN